MRYTYYYSHCSFFAFIYNTFGTGIVILLKKWIHHNKELIRISARNKYLLHCKRSNIFPKHLNYYRSSRFTFYNDISSRKADKYFNKFTSKILKLEIADNFKHRKSLLSSIYFSTRAIENNLPSYICKKFFYTQQKSLHKLFIHEENRFSKKLNWLHTIIIKENNKKSMNIKKIKYFCSKTSTNSINDVEITFNGFQQSPNTHLVELDPSSYGLDKKSITNPREKWFINSSNCQLPNEVIGLLQLGENFCLPPTDQSHLTIECIKHVESNLSKYQQYKFTGLFRSQICSFLNQIKHIDRLRTDTDREIIESLHITKIFTKDNPDIIFTRADKGNTVVALDRIDYYNKMEFLLSDNNTYSVLQRNPANKLLRDLKELLKRWINSKYIPAITHSYLNATNAILPRAYGLPKIHKPGAPLRIIISSSGSPLHNLAEFLQNIISRSLPKPFSHILNSRDLLKKLHNVSLTDDEVLVSLDVTSLFTNVPVDLVLEILDQNWVFIQKHTLIPKTEFLLAIKFVLDSTYFLFNNNFYRQSFGAPMGSPLSPIVADLVLQKLESVILDSLPVKPNFYYRYVDDIVLAAPSPCLLDILNKFNSFHSRLSFTMEIGGDRLNFLDLTLLKEKGSLISNWYQKPTFSGRFLNFYSHHPFAHKKGIILSLIDRVIHLSHPKFHKQNFDLIIRVLLDNGYPLELIFSTIRRRLHANHIPNAHTAIHTDQKPSYFTIPYVSSIAGKFIKYFKNIPFVKLAFSCYGKLNKIIKAHKDLLPSSSRPNVVYSIKCSNCDASYVGQTKRMLGVRIGEHRGHIRRNSTQTSVITDHRLQSNHDFDWDSVEILDEEINYKKRLISEMVYIKKQKRGLNLQSDTDLLDPIYNDLIHA